MYVQESNFVHLFESIPSLYQASTKYSSLYQEDFVWCCINICELNQKLTIRSPIGVGLVNATYHDHV